MDINSVSSTAAAQAASYSRTAAAEKTEKASSTNSAASSGVVYEKGSSTKNTEYIKKNEALIAKLKQDSDNRTAQLRGIVEKMMQKQGTAIGNADSMWKFLAGGKFSVSADVKAQAQKDIAENGYWGVEQTSDRIVDFAKALSGGDASKADELLDAFKKGFKEATKTWGKSLPDISSRTYDAVIEKFEKWTGSDKTETGEA